MDFKTLKNKYDWKEIYGCPGRFILKNADKITTPEELLNEKVIINSIRRDDTSDEILIARFKDGGLISYKKTDGTIIHTLNTEEGFLKKLQKLNIKPEIIR